MASMFSATATRTPVKIDIPVTTKKQAIITALHFQRWDCCSRKRRSRAATSSSSAIDEVDRLPLDAKESPPVLAVPVNVYKNKAPFTGKVVSTKRIVGPKATGETCHIIIDHEGDFPYWEGQSWGVMPPGVREKDGKPHAVRLYSIASSRYGDDMSGKTGSLCVRRATYWCPELKADDP